MNEHEDVLARDWPEDARRMRGSISEQDPEASENESQSSEDEAMSEVGQSHSREDDSDSSEDDSDSSEDESGSESGEDEPVTYDHALNQHLAEHAALMPSPDLAALALSDDFRNTMEKWHFVARWGPER